MLCSRPRFHFILFALLLHAHCGVHLPTLAAAEYLAEVRDDGRFTAVDVESDPAVRSQWRTFLQILNFPHAGPQSDNMAASVGMAPLATIITKAHKAGSRC